MKKIAFVAAIIFGVIAMTTVTSCKKVSNPEPIDTIDSSKTGTISCTAEAQLIDSIPTGQTTNPMENVPDGTVVTAWVDSDDYPGVGAAGQDLNWSTTVSGGAFSFTIPVPDDGIQVTVVPQQFRYDYVTFGPTVDAGRIFDANTFNVTLRPGQTELMDIVWN